jgi:hypothetical protein
LQLPLKVEMPYKMSIETTSILVLHEIVAAKFSNPEAWQQTILPDPSKLEPDWKTKTIALSMHGDEVPVTGIGKVWSRCALAFSWASMLALAGATVDVQSYTWGVFEKFVAPRTSTSLGTLGTLFAVMKWSFTALFYGVWPECDWRGIRHFDCTYMCCSYMCCTYMCCTYMCCTYMCCGAVFVHLWCSCGAALGQCWFSLWCNYRKFWDFINITLTHD